MLVTKAAPMISYVYILYTIYIERANAQDAADTVNLDGVVWSASYALARPQA